MSSEITKINIFDFIEMIEGPIGIVDCSSSDECRQIDCCTIKTPLLKINTKIIDTLKNITLDQISQRS